MAISITTQPTANSVVAAYRQINVMVNANQMPNNGNPCPVVIGDIYFDNIYYSSISITDLEQFIIWIFVFNWYTFDIQDKAQEYLKSKFARMYENTNGDMESATNGDLFSCSAQIKFREGYIDANGFTQFYGTAPTQGTKFTAPVAGTGTVTSNLFYIINSTLTHEDNPNFGAHLDTLKDPFQTTYALSHRPNYMTYINKRIGGGKYFICKEDNDFIFCFSNNSNPTWLVQVIGKYKNGTTFNTFPAIVPNYSVATPTPYKVYSFNAGIPNLKALFANVQWDSVIEYEVFVFHVFFQAMRQYYYVNQCGCCDEHTRIFFLNNLGTYDAINFSFKQETNKTNSEHWQSSLPSGLVAAIGAATSKSFTGNNRMQPKQNDFYEVTCSCYGEADKEWIKELLGTPRAYLHWNGIQGQANGLLPIIIEDSEIVTLKNKDRYQYVITLKFSLANERINLRN